MALTKTIDDGFDGSYEDIQVVTQERPLGLDAFFKSLNDRFSHGLHCGTLFAKFGDNFLSHRAHSVKLSAKEVLDCADDYFLLRQAQFWIKRQRQNFFRREFRLGEIAFFIAELGEAGLEMKR